MGWATSLIFRPRTQWPEEISVSTSLTFRPRTQWPEETSVSTKVKVDCPLVKPSFLADLLSSPDWCSFGESGILFAYLPSFEKLRHFLVRQSKLSS